MKTGQKGLALIKDFEGWYSNPYLDPVGIATIGYGFTYYLPGRKKVTLKDKPLSKAEGEPMLKEILTNYENDVLRMVKKPLTQNQFDALISFTYNLGATNLGKSTLLKKVNKDPNDPLIAIEFMKWVNAGGKPFNGLIRRRKAEADLYFTK